MVKVLMCQQQRIHPDTSLLEPAGNALRSVKKEIPTPQLKEITIRLGDAAGEHREVCHGL